jgi:radical SAM superfamily enzyme with C-terminal helix-hairpin-helix motif
MLRRWPNAIDTGVIVTRPKKAACLAVLAALISLTGGCERAAETTTPVFPSAPLIDPNTATQAQLNTVPGLSDADVAAIIAGRPFATPTALHALIGQGLSEEAQRSIYGAMFIRVGLNSGAEEDFKLIPSTMSPRKLAHEFEEYRPYESIEQFRREMAKYVSEEEVAHLTRYVTLDCSGRR